MHFSENKKMITICPLLLLVEGGVEEEGVVVRAKVEAEKAARGTNKMPKERTGSAPHAPMLIGHGEKVVTCVQLRGPRLWWQLKNSVMALVVGSMSVKKECLPQHSKWRMMGSTISVDEQRDIKQIGRQKKQLHWRGYRARMVF